MTHSILAARLLLKLRRQLSKDVINYGTSWEQPDALLSRVDTIDFASHHPPEDEFDYLSSSNH